MSRTPQLELPQSEAVFNLALQHGQDGERVAREQREAQARRAEAEAYQRKVQLTLEQCPGFAGCDAPSGPGITGKVVISPPFILEARRWLRRRYYVNENVELSTDNGLVFEFAPRIRRVTTGGHRVKVRFGKAEQFELALA